MLTDRLKTFLSHNATSFACVVLACLGRIVHLLTSSALLTDKSYQLQAGKNFAEGNGITILEAPLTDLSASHFVPLVKWPPAYSVLTSPFNSLGGSGYLTGSLVIDIFSCIFFVFFARKIFQLSDKPVWQSNLYTLIIGFSFYHFGLGRSTDLLATTFFLGGTYFVIRSIKTSFISFKHVAAAILLLWLSAFTRYLSIPLAIIPPLYLVIYSHYNKIASLKRPSLVMLSGLSVLLILQLIVQKMTGGSSTYLYPFEKGWFPEHLKHTAPFLFESMGNLEPLVITAGKMTGTPFEDLQSGLIYLHLLLVIILTAFFGFRTLINRFFVRRFEDHFLYLAIIFSVATLIILGYLSITYDSKTSAGRFWTYIAELRYYSVPIFFAQLAFFLFAYRKGLNRLAQITLRAILIFMIASGTHQLLFVAKAAMRKDLVFTGRKDFRELENGANWMHKVSDTSRVPVVCLSNEPVFTNYVTMELGNPGVHDINRSFTELATTKPVLTFIALKKQFGDRIANEMQLTEQHKLSETPNWIFYLKKFEP